MPEKLDLVPPKPPAIIVPSPIPMEIIPGATLTSGKELERQSKWMVAASYFYTVYQTSDDLVAAGEGLTNWAQMDINLGNLNEAAKTLNHDQDPKFAGLKNIDWQYLQADIAFRRAWIADELGDFREALSQVKAARVLVDQVLEKERTARVWDLDQSVSHFEARAFFGSGVQGINRDHLETAENLFANELMRYKALRREGEPYPANEGFQQLWLARIYLVTGELERAEGRAEAARELFSEYSREVPTSGISAHYDRMIGSIALRKGLIEEAKRSFVFAFSVNTEFEKYPKGAGEAAWGLAKAFAMEGKGERAVGWSNYAVSVYPQILLRGFIE